MPPTIEILIGHLLSGREARFLRALSEAFAGQDSLILANFHVRFQQVDFVVVTGGGAAILEHKWFEGAIHGDVNGQWTIVDASGRRVPYPGGNPWRQALDQKYALSDEMRTYQAANPDVPLSSTGRCFKELAAFVCIEPRIHDQSEVISGDERVWIRSSADTIADVRRGATRSIWTIADWRRFAMSRLRLRPVSLAEATDATVRQPSFRAESSNALGPLGKNGAIHCRNSASNVPPRYLLDSTRIGSSSTFEQRLMARRASSKRRFPMRLGNVRSSAITRGSCPLAIWISSAPDSRMHMT